MSYIKVMDELIKLMLKPMGKVFSIRNYFKTAR